MSYTVGKKHNGGHVILEFEGVYVSGGHSGNRHYPGHPPDVTFDEARIVEDDLDRDLSPIEVFEAHDAYFLNQLEEQYSWRHSPPARNFSPEEIYRNRY